MTLRDPETRNQLVRYVEDHAEEQLQFLMGLSRENSFSWNKAGTDRVAKMVLELLAPLFVAAHMDTVFPPDHPFKDVWVEGDKLRGPGTGDMKAGRDRAFKGRTGP